MQIKAPNTIPRLCSPTAFLGGSIEMGNAPDWQADIAPRLENAGWLVLNPRRDDWDPTWEQSMDNPNFVEQVNWELDAIEKTGVVLFYFAPGTKSPITLLELGLVAARIDHFNNYDADGFSVPNTVVVCPDGFWRIGNVDIVCRRYGVPQAATLDTAIKWINAVRPDA